MNDNMTSATIIPVKMHWARTEKTIRHTLENAQAIEIYSVDGYNFTFRVTVGEGEDACVVELTSNIRKGEGYRDYKYLANGERVNYLALFRKYPVDNHANYFYRYNGGIVRNLEDFLGYFALAFDRKKCVVTCNKYGKKFLEYIAPWIGPRDYGIHKKITAMIDTIQPTLPPTE